MRTLPRKRFTDEQLQLERIIRSLGLDTLLEWKVGGYFLDVFLPEVNKAIEYDSKYHFSKKRDSERDMFLEKNFKIKTLRITNLKDSNLIGRIKEFVESK